MSQIFILGYGYGVWRHFQQYFSYIVSVSFIGEGNQRNRRKPPTGRKSLTNVMTYVLSSTPRHAKSITLKIKRTVSLEWFIVLGGGGDLRTVIKVSVYIYVGCLMHNIGLCILFCQPYFFHSMTSPLHYLSFKFSIHGNWIPTKRKYKPHLSIVNTTFSYHVSLFFCTNQTLTHDGFT